MHFLITSGGTKEYIDPVRFISNASSGKMGDALVRAVVAAGHEVTLISASESQPPVGVDYIGVESAKEMFEAVKKCFAKVDCLIMAAAVADYTPAKVVKTKIKKTNQPLTIKLKPTADILKWAGSHKAEGQIVVGFSLEDKAVRAAAEKKLKEKKLDIVVCNTPEAIGADKSSVQIKVVGGSWSRIENAAKAVIAKKVIRLVEKISL
ncbi:MAG: phosphopantothenoylcysteine decarboxylase [Planctomycetes bacterium]|nr:phosphopantothenoylcysteine decarboxylase [Planctomycetota bacterium]